jgi:hypothetical protein
MEATREWVDETLASLCEKIGCPKPRIVWAPFSNFFFNSTKIVTFRADRSGFRALGKPKEGRLFLSPEILQRWDAEIRYVLAKSLAANSAAHQRRTVNLNLVALGLASTPWWILMNGAGLSAWILRVQPLLTIMVVLLVINTPTEAQTRVSAIELNGEIQPAIEEIRAQIDRVHYSDEATRQASFNREVAELRRQLRRRHIQIPPDFARSIEQAPH